MNGNGCLILTFKIRTMYRRVWRVDRLYKQIGGERRGGVSVTLVREKKRMIYVTVSFDRRT